MDSIHFHINILIKFLMFSFALVFFHVAVLAKVFSHYISIFLKMLFLFSLNVMVKSPRGESAMFSDGCAKAVRG